MERSQSEDIKYSLIDEGHKRDTINSNYVMKLIIILSFLGIIAVFIVVKFFNRNGDNHEEVSLSTCFVEPACIPQEVATAYNSQTGFTNLTGWISSDNSCCQICAPNTSSTVCFGDPPSLNCSKKTGNEDYDYIMLDQIYLPSLCNALLQSHDPTLSHLEYSTCTPSVTSGVPKLSIHGLWPNYVDGYPQCCNSSGTLSTLNPNVVEDWTIWPDMVNNWLDPTTSAISSKGTNCSTCYLLNQHRCWTADQQVTLSQQVDPTVGQQSCFYDMRKLINSCNILKTAGSSQAKLINSWTTGWISTKSYLLLNNMPNSSRYSWSTVDHLCTVACLVIELISSWSSFRLEVSPNT